MRQIYKIILSICLIVSIFTPQFLYADNYRVISIRGCTATINDNIIHVGDEVPGNAKFTVKKLSGYSSWAIKLQSISTGKIHPLCSPTTKNNSKDNSDSWLSWFWNNITGQKKCSTRAPENELTEGLANNLSQTYYLYYPFDNSTNSNIDFATNLEDGTCIKCSYCWKQEIHSFEIPVSKGMFSLSSKYFDIRPSDERTILRLEVKYITQEGDIIHITDSMNVILINDEF